MKHLEIAVNLINNDIKDISEKTKSQFIQFRISQHQMIEPENANQEDTKLNFDINQYLPAIGSVMIKKQLKDDFGITSITEQLYAFFTAINDHHSLLMRRNQDLHYKNNINSNYMPFSSLSDNDKNKQNQKKNKKYKHRNNSNHRKNHQ